MNKFFNLIDKKFKFQIFSYIFLILVQIIFESFGIALIPIFLSFILNPDLILNIPINYIKNILLSISEEKLILYAILSLIIIFLLKSFFTVFLVIFQSDLNAKINLDLKNLFFKSYLKSKYQFLKQYNSSDILRNVDEEISKFSSNFFLMISFFKDLFLALIIFAILIYVDYYSAIISLVFMLSLSIGYLFFWKKKLTEIGETLLTSKKLSFQWIIQSFSMIKEIIISDKADKASNEFLKNAFLFENAKKRLRIIQGIPGPIFELLIVSFVLFAVMIVLNFENKNPVPILSLYAIAAIRLLPIFSRFSNYIVSIRSILPTIELLQNELKKLKDQKNINKRILTEDDVSNLDFNKYIFLKDISFKYEKNDYLILNEINLKINKGSCIAFVGKSGSGKTTLINLISGLLDPFGGKIYIDDKSIKNSLGLWQNKIGLLSQDNYLIDDTIKNNITLLNDENEIDKDKLEQAVLYSGTNEILKNLPNKLDTKVGEGGAFLSGGQIQRIALARLFYRDPEVMIFDEFTNSLDHENEEIILKNISNLRKYRNKTIILISHKMKPLKISDEIHIIKEGKILKTMDYDKFYKDYSAIMND